MIGTIATLGAAAAGTAASAISQNKTNKQNEKIASQQNAFNKQMYEQQLKDAKDWYNEFESPMALRRQWQAAGFSPMAALNGGNTGSGMQSVGSADAASYEYQSPLSGVGGNMMQAVAAANNYLSTQVQREKSLAEIEAQKIQNQRDQIALGYERDNYVKDKLASRLSLSKGFDHGAAASMDNYIANGPYERAFKLYDSYMSQRKSAELRLENARAKNTTTDTELKELEKQLKSIDIRWQPLLNRASIGLTNSQRATLDKMRPIQYLNEKNKYSLGQLDISNYSNNHARDFGLSSGSNNLVDYFIKLLGIKWETDPLADNEIYYDDVYNNLNIPKDKAFFRHYLKVPKLSPVDVENYDYVEEDEKIYSDELAEFHCDNGFLNYDDVQKFFKRVRQQLKYYYGIDYVRYFCCGEYSPAPHYTPDGRLTEGFLPHYHLLIWFKHSLKSQYGWIKPVPKRNKNRLSEYLPLVTLLPDGRAHVPPLSVAVFQDFLFRGWNLSDRKAFVCSPVRSIVGCTRYISKYILKAVNAEHYKDDVQALRPFHRWMSQGIAKGYAEHIAPQICTNFSFGFQDGQYFRFYPSIFLKWSYSHDIDIQKNDYLKWYDNEKYFIMLRNREKYISEMEEPTLRDVEDKCIKVRNMLETLSADAF
ncbi:unnamed protein product [Cylicocyclus nassatus]|uniref:DNA pilot protein n=1 Tax=Cylicocyclus nassatus TaxID=53992 RepID=A0AA36GQV3_CYLNA|nr:unnamed protein product [Cylicocyclus nassatus]CAJ0596506.1 unnamed protein product [Cylicocyclus nassatus]